MTAFYNETLMLLGPGQEEYLQQRRKVRLELIEMGYKKVIIMEDEMDKLKDISFDDKFRRLV